MLPNNQKQFDMKTKINLFTAMIFAYSIIVCKVCKNEDGTLLLSKSNTINTQTSNKPIVNAVSTNNVSTVDLTITASNVNSNSHPNQ
jgi:uncharacterized metal-binding protein